MQPAPCKPACHIWTLVHTPAVHPVHSSAEQNAQGQYATRSPRYQSLLSRERRCAEPWCSAGTQCKPVKVQSKPSLCLCCASTPSPGRRAPKRGKHRLKYDFPCPRKVACCTRDAVSRPEWPCYGHTEMIARLQQSLCARANAQTALHYHQMMSELAHARAAVWAGQYFFPPPKGRLAARETPKMICLAMLPASLGCVCQGSSVRLVWDGNTARQCHLRRLHGTQPDQRDPWETRTSTSTSHCPAQPRAARPC